MEIIPYRGTIYCIQHGYDEILKYYYGENVVDRRALTPRELEQIERTQWR